jgi:hypothetical protein
MYSEARKLHVIEEVLKVKNEAVLIELEAVLKKNSDIENASGKTITRKPSDFAGSISKEVAEAMLTDIQQSRNEWERDF